MNDYIKVLSQYTNTLISKFNTKENIDKLDYKQKVGIIKDIEGLVFKCYENDKNNPIFKEIFLDKVIPYLARFFKNRRKYRVYWKRHGNFKAIIQVGWQYKLKTFYNLLWVGLERQVFRTKNRHIEWLLSLFRRTYIKRKFFKRNGGTAFWLSANVQGGTQAY